MADQKVTFPIEGMSCQHCVKRATEALEGVDGVTAADVDLDAAQATVTLADGVTRDRLAEAVASVGYEVPAEV